MAVTVPVTITIITIVTGSQGISGSEFPPRGGGAINEQGPCRKHPIMHHACGGSDVASGLPDPAARLKSPGQEPHGALGDGAGRGHRLGSGGDAEAWSRS
jgi:hypothetical protein